MPFKPSQFVALDTQTQKRVLIKFYWGEKLSFRKIGKKVGKSAEYVFRLMKKYKIPTRTRPKGPKWNEREISYLIKNYSILGAKKIATYLNRPAHSVAVKAMEIGIKWFGEDLENLEPMAFNDFELGLLIGLIEGEGTITIKSRERKSCKPFASISVANTDPEILEVAGKLLGAGITDYMLWKMRESSTCPQARLSAVPRILRILLAIEPFLISDRKRELANRVIEFCRLRIEGWKKYGKHNAPFSKRELEIYEEVKKLNDHS